MKYEAVCDRKVSERGKVQFIELSYYSVHFDILLKYITYGAPIRYKIRCDEENNEECTRIPEYARRLVNKQ